MIPVQQNAACDHNLLNDYVEHKVQFLFAVNSRTVYNTKRIKLLFCRKLSKCIQIHFISSIGSWNCLHYTWANLVCTSFSNLNEKKEESKQANKKSDTCKDSHETAFHCRNKAQLGWMVAPRSWLDFHSSLKKRKLEVSISDFLPPFSVGRT